MCAAPSDPSAALGIDVELDRGGGHDLRAAFDCPPGITVLFGPSGAGKSTCLALVAGIERPTRGTIRFGAEVLTDVRRRLFVPARRRRFALVPQSLALFPHMTAIENVAFGIPPGVRGDERSARARSWLDRLHVGRLAERRPTTFSGGEAQRVAVARALASEPRALLLDEPFTALDAPLREAVGDEIRALVVELGLVAILVTHDRAEALRLGDRAVTLAHGAVVAKGTPPEVL